MRISKQPRKKSMISKKKMSEKRNLLRKENRKHDVQAAGKKCKIEANKLERIEDKKRNIKEQRKTSKEQHHGQKGGAHRYTK